MTQEDLQKKHSAITWSASTKDAQEQINISIEFATQCMHDVLKSYYLNSHLHLTGQGEHKNISTIIAEKIKEIKTKQP